MQIAVRPSSAAFHPPQDPKVPMIMFCAGSGLAPMRGFLQERAMQRKSGRDVSKTLLFFGCRSPTEDFIYSDSDLKEWIESDIVDVRPAFSRTPDKSLGCKYVQEWVNIHILPCENTDDCSLVELGMIAKILSKYLSGEPRYVVCVVTQVGSIAFYTNLLVLYLRFS